MKKNVVEIILDKIFLTNLFLITLKSFETHFDLIACKIEAKLNNLVIYGDNSKNFEYKIDHISQTKNRIIVFL